MSELNKKEIGARLKEFALKKYGRLQPMADEFGMGYGAFYTSYISGKSLPGAKFISKLVKLGCDIDWLLHGDEAGLNMVSDHKLPNLQEDCMLLKKENAELREKLEAIKKIIV